MSYAYNARQRLTEDEKPGYAKLVIVKKVRGGQPGYTANCIERHKANTTRRRRAITGR